ncbi:MAG TPA: lipocalin-like domain-containing protein [Roseiarcus sp.]
MSETVTGVWILRSAYLERIDTGERVLPYGENPRGVLILHEGGRMAAIITPSEMSGDTLPPRRKLLAYSGRYRIEPPNRFVTDVDISPGSRAGSARCGAAPSRYATVSFTS